MDLNYAAKKAVAAEALREIDPRQPLGTELFNAVARVSVSVAIEAVALRQPAYRSELEVFLVRQTADNPTFPGYWHCPGTIMRPGEEVKDGFLRLSQREFHARIIEWREVDRWNNPSGDPRGHHYHLIHLVKVDLPDPPEEGRWYPVDELPEDTMPYHRDSIIPLAVLQERTR